MIQLIFGAFCIVFGATVVFMKKEQLQNTVLFGKRYLYENKLDKLDGFLILIRVLCGILALLGIYIFLASGVEMFINR